jgi:hypothetical protein
MNEQNKKIAEYAGIKFSHIGKAMGATDEDLERFAELVDAAAVAREREACAKLCEDVGHAHEVMQGSELAFDLAKTIRGRTE